jgi:tetratricopeptide (TPR) repeat protein
MRKPLVAILTLVAFAALEVWPLQASAGEGKAAAAPAAEAAPPADDATLQQAKQHFETGRNAYNAGDYVTAIREFKQAEALRPSPILAYNIGLANEKLGKRRVAVKYYRRYLELQPNASNRAEVEGKISTLEAEIAANPGPAANAQPGGTATQPGAATVQEQPGDMPPADPNARAGATQQAGYYDPYASQAPPGSPQAKKQGKRRSLWWLGIVIPGAVVITIVIPVIIWLYVVDTYSTTAANHALTALPSGAERINRNENAGVTLFHF